MCYRVREPLNANQSLGNAVWVLQALLLYFIIVKDWLIGIINIPEASSFLQQVTRLSCRYIHMWELVAISRSAYMCPLHSQWLLHWAWFFACPNVL